MLGEDLHDPAIRGEVTVLRDLAFLPGLAGHLEERAEPVGLGLVRPEHPEVALRRVQPHDVAQHVAEYPGGLGRPRAGLLDGDGVVAEVWQDQVPEQQPAVGVRRGAEPALAAGDQAEQVRLGSPVGGEQLVRPVRVQPLFQHRQVDRVGPDPGQRHLVRPPGSFHRQAVHFGRAGPALGRAQHDERPVRPRRGGGAGWAGGAGGTVRAGWRRGLRACAILDGPDRIQRAVERGGEVLVHDGGVVAGDVHRLVAVAAQQRVQLVVRYPGQQGGVGDLPAVQVQDRQHRAVPGRVDEPVAVPARGQRPGLRLTVPDNAGHHQVRVVERGAEGVRQRVAELAALVDGARRLRRDVARHPAGEGEPPEQLAQARTVLRHTRPDLAVAALQPGVGQPGRAAVARADDQEHVLVPLADGPVQVGPDEVQARGGAPVAKKPRLDVIRFERLGQQRIGEQVDLAGGQVVGGAPVPVQRGQLGISQRSGNGGGHRSPRSIAVDLARTRASMPSRPLCMLAQPGDIGVNAQRRTAGQVRQPSDAAGRRPARSGGLRGPARLTRTR